MAEAVTVPQVVEAVRQGVKPVAGLIDTYSDAPETLVITTGTYQGDPDGRVFQIDVRDITIYD